MLNTPANLEWIKRLFADGTRDVVFHNAKFDLEMFHVLGVDVFGAKAQFHCTMIMAKMWNGLMMSYKLEDLAPQFLNRDTTDKKEITEWLKANTRAFFKEYGRKPTFKDAPIEMVKRRNVWDVKSTIMLFHYFRPRIARECQQLYDTERALMLVVVDMQSRGVEIDLTRTRLLRAQALAGVKRLKREMQQIVGTLHTTKLKKRSKNKVKYFEEIPVTIDEFNPGSPIHKELAFRKLGFVLKYKTKPKKIKKGPKKGHLSGGGRWSFDEYAMIRYVSPPLAYILKESGEEGWPVNRFHDAVHEAVEKHKIHRRELLPPLILKCTELAKMVSTYYDHFIENCVDVRIDEHGREIGVLHCNFNQSEAMTGRFSSSDPNLQNQPRILGPRECFVTRPRRRNWHFDYAQVEMKFFCHFARDPDMAAAIDDDIHLYVASQIYNVPKDQVTKEQRKRAKAINFGILYGAGGAKIASSLTERGLYTTPTEGMTLVAKYHRRFPSIRRLSNELKVQLIRNKFITNPFGRRYHLDAEEGYKAINYICQGSPADLMKQAMVKIWRYLREHGLQSKILIQVHDELVIEMPRNEEAGLVPEIITMMEDRTSYYVPITVDAEIAPIRWSEKVDAEKLARFPLRKVA